MLGQWLGVSHRIGSDMCYWIMGVSGIHIAETTVQHVTQDKMMYSVIASEIKKFNELLTTRLDDTNFKLSGVNNGFEDVYEDLLQWDLAYGDNTPTDKEYDKGIIPLVDAEGNIDPDILDKYIETKIVLDNKVNGGGNLVTVKSRLTDINGRPIGTAHNNPSLDDREYEIELEDGTTDRIFANKIAKRFIYNSMTKEDKF